MAEVVVAVAGDSISAGSPLWDPDPAVRARIAAPDERSQWQWWASRDDPRLTFVRAEASTLTAFPPAANFIMSQSTIEHIDDDLRFFQHVRDHVQARGEPTLQVHLCPSAACLPTYLWHGVRQYTPRTLSRITSLFADSDLWLFRLGGHACNRLHFQFITGPHFIWRTGDRRAKEPAPYQARLVRALAEDMSQPQQSPAFYALVIHTHPRSRLF